MSYLTARGVDANNKYAADWILCFLEDMPLFHSFFIFLCICSLLSILASLIRYLPFWGAFIINSSIGFLLGFILSSLVDKVRLRRN